MMCLMQSTFYCLEYFYCIWFRCQLFIVFFFMPIASQVKSSMKNGFKLFLHPEKNQTCQHWHDMNFRPLMGTSSPNSIFFIYNLERKRGRNQLFVYLKNQNIYLNIFLELRYFTFDIFLRNISLTLLKFQTVGQRQLVRFECQWQRSEFVFDILICQRLITAKITKIDYCHLEIKSFVIAWCDF